MSHANGLVKFNDGTIKYFEYDGTSDIPRSHLYDNYNDMIKNWRIHEWLKCDSDCIDLEDTMFFTDYGGGFYFEGKACKKHNALLVDIDFHIIERNETDDWASRL
jgi:hypothetical protein